LQTFLPYGSNFHMNAFCLDPKRLGKQRVETFQILNAMHSNAGWRNHPATVMWRPYPDSLLYYGVVMCREWIDRGYNDRLLNRFYDMVRTTEFSLPPWIDDERIIISHRSNLIRKYPEHYGRLWPEIPNDMPYYWPTERE
jgi:hypothetical protein